MMQKAYLSRHFFIFLGLLFIAFLVSSFGVYAQDGQITPFKATIGPAKVGQATLSGSKAVLSKEQLQQLEECISRTHLYPWDRAKAERSPNVKANPVVSEPSTVRDGREPNPEASADFNFRIIHELTSTEAGSYRADVMEPSAAFNNRHGLITGNWFAAASRTETSFKYINPWADWPLYPPRTGYQYCCDQEVIFDPVTQCFFWSILYVSTNNTGGYLRIAVSKDPNSGRWWYYDFDAESDGANDSTLPDYPHLALSRNYLYITYNEFDPSFSETYLLRWPTLPMSMAKGFTYYYFHTSDVVTLKVASDHNHHSTMYAVSNWAPGFPSIRVYEWKEGPSSIYYHDITGLNSWSWSSYSCADPDNNNPCGRLDDRVTAAVATNNRLFPEDCRNQLWVAWTAAQDDNYPYPYTYIVKVCLDDWSVIGYSNIWNSAFAFAYPAMAANARGDIGVTGDLLGGTYYNAFYVIPIDEYTGYSPGYSAYTVAIGDSGATEWGDYNGCAAWYPNMYQWIGAGHVRYSGKGSTAYYVRFGRERDNDPGILPCDCDLNGDGNCDMADWLLFGNAWGRTDCPVTNNQ